MTELLERLEARRASLAESTREHMSIADKEAARGRFRKTDVHTGVACVLSALCAATIAEIDCLKAMEAGE